MSDSFIAVAQDGTGKKMQTKVNTIGANDVHAEGVFLVDEFGIRLTCANSPGESPMLQVSASGSEGNPFITQSGGLLLVRLQGGLSTVNANIADGSDVALGAQADSPASDDTGTWSLIALFKRSLQRLTSLVANTSRAGAGNSGVIRATASTTAGTLAIARATRRGILIRNLDAAITIYVGPATVTSGNGFPILPGESCPFSWVGLIQVIAASGTPAYAAWDEYD